MLQSLLTLYHNRPRGPATFHTSQAITGGLQHQGHKSKTSITVQSGYSGAIKLRFNTLKAVRTIQEIVDLGLVMEKRPNPKQRRKLVKQKLQGNQAASTALK